MRISKTQNQRKHCVIEGLSIGVSDIRATENKVIYDTDELDLLLLTHSDKITFKLIDDLFFSPDTIDVFEFDGRSYAIKYQKN